MQPPVAIALDRTPYNVFTLRCVASVPSGVRIQKSFEWRSSGIVIIDNGNTVLISNRRTTLAQSYSELTVNENAAGDYTYNCTVRMMLPGLDIVASALGEVTVKSTHYSYRFKFLKNLCSFLFL